MSTQDRIGRRRERVAELTGEGVSAADIAAMLGCTKRTIVRDRQALGIAQPPPRPLTVEEVARARVLLDDGCSYNEIARTLQRSLSTISRRFPGRGWVQEQTSEHVRVLKMAVPE